MCLCDNTPSSTDLTVKQLHDDAGRSVRRAGATKRPIPITGCGELVAVLASARLVRPHQRKRVLLPEYTAMMAKPVGVDIQPASGLKPLKAQPICSHR